jgi:hypothetical protein
MPVVLGERKKLFKDRIENLLDIGKGVLKLGEIIRKSDHVRLLVMVKGVFCISKFPFVHFLFR